MCKRNERKSEGASKGENKGKEGVTWTIEANSVIAQQAILMLSRDSITGICIQKV